MYNPQFIQFHNLFSHRETKFAFEVGKLTLIHGENKDAKGTNSNGGGKSTLIEAIYLALHGECYREVDKLDFISKWANECTVLFSLYSPVQKESLEIRRTFFRKRGTKVEIWVNEVLQEQLTSVAESNQFLFERLGVSKEDLGNHYVISQGNNSSFFTATDTRQKEIIGRFANFSRIDKLLLDVRTQLKVTERDIQVLEGELYGKEAAVTNLVNIVENTRDLHRQQVAEHAEAVQQLQGAYDRLKTRHQQDGETLAEEVEAVETKRQELFPLGEQVEATREAVTVLHESEERLEEYQTSLHTLQREAVKLRLVLAGTLRCPKCGEEFVLKGDLTQLQGQLTTNEGEQASLERKIEKRTNKVTLQKKAARRHEQLVDELAQKQRQLRGMERALEIAQGELIRTNRDLKNREKQLYQLKGNPPLQRENSGVGKLKKQLVQLQTEISEVKEALETLLTKKEDLQFWELHFGTKGFKTYLANETIGVVEKLVNYSLSKLFTELSVVMRGYKVLKNGELRDKITIQVQSSDGTVGPYARYSGGERGRINVAGILALHQLSNMNTNGRGLNLLCLDENIEGLDTQGQLEVLGLLAAHKITTLVITHHHPEFLPTTYRKVVIRKQNGVSSIVPTHEATPPRRT